jgi:hypothetical protein
MLSVDTPETTPGAPKGAAKIDDKFLELAQWIKDGTAQVSTAFAHYILPRLETGKAGSLQFNQGEAASDFAKAQYAIRLTRDDGSERQLFIRTGDEKFDSYGRLLAYVAPSYGKKERDAMRRRDKATFNLDLIASGHGMPFVLFPSIPGELDLPLMVELALQAKKERRGQYADDLFLPAYEYRACEKLYKITRKALDGSIRASERYGWRSRYCADMRDRSLYGPENYMHIPQPYRLWLWPQDVQRAIAALNLIPATGKAT